MINTETELSDIKLMHGDCLELMKQLPDASVDLVLTDPPYGTAGGMGKNEERYSRIANVEWDKALEPAAFLQECNRVLRINGALVLFGQEPYTSRLITEAHSNIPFSYRLMWLKDHFSNSLLVNKAPVSYFEDIMVFFKKYDLQCLHPLRHYSMRILEHCGGRLKDINAKLGHRRAEHFFYVDSTQFGLCTADTYQQLCNVFSIHLQDWFKPFEELEEINRRFNVRFSRRFNLTEGHKFKSNVLQYKKDYTGYHPTQKPVALLDDLIRTYSNQGDTVLDFTMGSGSTGVACVNTGRNFIGIEMDDEYFEIAKKRIEDAKNG